MKINITLSAFTDAKSAFWRPMKYLLFQPFGLAAPAAYCWPYDEIQGLNKMLTLPESVLSDTKNKENEQGVAAPFIAIA